MYNTSENGFFGSYGGKYLPEVLRGAVDELEIAFNKYMKDEEFLSELKILQKDYIGRATPLMYAPKATELLGGAQIYIKLEGLANTGAHKINNAIGQVERKKSSFSCTNRKSGKKNDRDDRKRCIYIT